MLLVASSWIPLKTCHWDIPCDGTLDKVNSTSDNSSSPYFVRSMAPQVMHENGPVKHLLWAERPLHGLRSYAEKWDPHLSNLPLHWRWVQRPLMIHMPCPEKGTLQSKVDTQVQVAALLNCSLYANTVFFECVQMRHLNKPKMTHHLGSYTANYMFKSL